VKSNGVHILGTVKLIKARYLPTIMSSCAL
jgi:hypothetical protein